MKCNDVVACVTTAASAVVSDNVNVDGETTSSGSSDQPMQTAAVVVVGAVVVVCRRRRDAASNATVCVVRVCV